MAVIIHHAGTKLKHVGHCYVSNMKRLVMV
jgi:hypothetical protein